LTALGSLLHLIGQYGYLLAFFGVMLESAGVPLQGETVLIIAWGVLVHRGVLDYGEALFFSIFSAVAGEINGGWLFGH
jgi:membrane protein DedA with SNARE-associated domain